MFIMSQELQNFNEMRDKAVEGLSRCDVIPDDGLISELGYTRDEYVVVADGNDEHEFTIYLDGKDRMVFVQTYTEREGGMYFQTFYAKESVVSELEALLVADSVDDPSPLLIETILHFKGLNIPGTARRFADNSIYQGCHHFLSIAKDETLSELAVTNFRNKVANGDTAERFTDERTSKILQVIRLS